MLTRTCKPTSTYNTYNTNYTYNSYRAAYTETNYSCNRGNC